MTARDAYALPLAAAVAGAILGVGVALYAVDAGARLLRWAVGR